MPVRLGRSPAPEAMVTILPQPRSAMAGATACTNQNALSTLARNMACQSVSSISVMVHFPASLDEMRIYWRDVGGHGSASDFDHLFDALLAAGLTVDGV